MANPPDTPPGAPATGPPAVNNLRPDQLNQLGNAPTDPGNPNAPAQPAVAPQNVINVDQNTGTASYTINVNGRPITVVISNDLQPTDMVTPTTGAAMAAQKAAGGTAGTVQDEINKISSWYKDLGTRQRVIDQLYSAGLITSKKSVSVEEVAMAWSTVVQEAALENQGTAGGKGTSPEELLAKAAQQGWNEIQPKLGASDLGARGTGNLDNAIDKTSQSSTVYTSFVDPATAMGTLADASYRLMGRNPTPEEYQAFLQGVLKPYQEASNTGRFETKTSGPEGQQLDPNTGLPVNQSGTTGGTQTQANIVSQRSIGQRGLEFLAGQTALANPESANYQAATTVFSSILRALGSPGSGLTSSGPTTTAP